MSRTSHTGLWITLGVIASLIIMAPVAVPVGVMTVLAFGFGSGADCGTAQTVTSWSGAPTTSNTFRAGQARITMSPATWSNAAGIYATGKAMGVDDNGVKIALMVALQESGLKVLSNTSADPASAGVPNQGDGSDHDSFGLYQQRPSANWGSWQQLMDVVYSTSAFFGGKAGPRGGKAPKGLLDIKNWESLDPGKAAQKVQVSATPDAYGKWAPIADMIDQALISANISSTFSTSATTSTDTSSSDPWCGQGQDAAGGAVSLAGMSSDQAGQAVADFAKQFVGGQYVWGDAGPATGTPGKFDCSGLVMYTYQHFGINLVHLAAAQGKTGKTVSAADAKVGDIVAWNDGSHVAILIGPNQIVEAASPKLGIRTGPIWSKNVHFQHILND
jgi:cell wall-associated NlpC family hydrolase